MPRHLQKGCAAEDKALEYLQSNGLTLYQRNYRTPFGEIDLIMIEKNPSYLVFVEVRYRKSDRFGSPAESVNKRKQKKLIASAEHFRQNYKKLGRQACRFDVISICGSLDHGSVQWHQNAF